MKKLIILITTLLSLNLFGGLVHKDVETVAHLNIGLEVYNRLMADIEPSIAFKTYLLKDKRLSIYVGGKLADEIFVENKYNVYNNIKIMGIIGTERDYDTVKFYQQLGTGIGYYTDFMDVSKLSIPIDLEFGTNYQNYLITFTIGSNVLLDFVSPAKGNLVLKLGLGYEF